MRLRVARLLGTALLVRLRVARLLGTSLQMRLRVARLLRAALQMRLRVARLLRAAGRHSEHSRHRIILLISSAKIRHERAAVVFTITIIAYIHTVVHIERAIKMRLGIAWLLRAARRKAIHPRHRIVAYVLPALILIQHPLQILLKTRLPHPPEAHRHAYHTCEVHFSILPHI
jgi:hypothetical protein